MSTDEQDKAVREQTEPEYRIKISATQRITYIKEITLEKDSYDRIMAAYNSGSDRKLSYEIEGIFEERDVADWEDYEDVEIKLLAALEDDHE